MSTYYYLGCETHRERVPFWSRYAGGPSVIPTARDEPETVQTFIDTHLQCGMSVFSEHDERTFSYACAVEDDVPARPSIPGEVIAGELPSTD